MLGLHDIVKINHDDKEHGVEKGQQGTIIDILADGDAFVEEFYDNDGNTIEDALFVDYASDELILVTSFNNL